MGDKKWILGLVVLIILIGLAIWGFSANKKSNTSQIAGQSTANYFSEDATVQYFYSDACHWCQEESKVLTKLSEEGYKVKSMNVGVNTNYWKDYNIQGTPTFIAQNGDRLEGYNEYDPLKSWLDQHK